MSTTHCSEYEALDEERILNATPLPIHQVIQDTTDINVLEGEEER